MQNQSPEEENLSDLLIESRMSRVSDRPKKLESLIDTQAMRFLEAMDFQSFDNLSSAFEKFMMDAPLFQGDIAFSRAAAALDLTAKLFATIDTDKNSLISREEFAYLLLKTTEANRQALAWLIENFNAFTQACFFKDQIAKDDIEAARNVFHGLKLAHEKFGFNKQPSKENLSALDPEQIQAFLDANKGNLSPHEVSGLGYLLEHVLKVKKDGPAQGKNQSELEHADKRLDNETKEKKDRQEKQADKEENKELADKLEGKLSEKELQALAGVLDAKSLRTLQASKLNSFESLFNAFAELIEDALGFKGKTPFDKAGNAFDSSANIVSEVDLDPEHLFTKSELLIISKLSQNKDKRQLSWVAKHFDNLVNALKLPGKASKKDLRKAGNVFHGLGFLSDRFEFEGDASKIPKEQMQLRLKHYLQNHPEAREARNKAALEDLLKFMERHSN